MQHINNIAKSKTITAMTAAMAIATAKRTTKMSKAKAIWIVAVVITATEKRTTKTLNISKNKPDTMQIRISHSF